ncbi:response regulator transcription factor [Nonomuraea sp. NPDC050451]|uniref:response regulator transcription factor n=1 Tax=Nonomuraea sp. NPDC050451 TaxID=3364364 RepID=UPI0037BCA073
MRAQFAQIRLMSGDARGCVQILLEAGGGTWLPLAEPQFRAELLALLSTAALRCGDRDTAGRSADDAEAAVAPPRRLGLLTEREREIAELAAEGKRSREIADRLFLSPRTVEAHLASVYRKLEVSSRTALAAVLLRMPDVRGR